MNNYIFDDDPFGYRDNNIDRALDTLSEDIIRELKDTEKRINKDFEQKLQDKAKDIAKNKEEISVLKKICDKMSTTGYQDDKAKFELNIQNLSTQIHNIDKAIIDIDKNIQEQKKKIKALENTASPDNQKSTRLDNLEHNINTVKQELERLAADVKAISDVVCNDALGLECLVQRMVKRFLDNWGYSIPKVHDPGLAETFAEFKDEPEEKDSEELSWL